MRATRARRRAGPRRSSRGPTHCARYPQEQDASGSTSVAEGRRNGREDRSRYELDDRDEGRLCRAAATIRVDEHRDPGRPLGGVEAANASSTRRSSRLPKTVRRTTDPPEHETRTHRGHGYSGRRARPPPRPRRRASARAALPPRARPRGTRAARCPWPRSPWPSARTRNRDPSRAPPALRRTSPPRAGRPVLLPV